MVNSYLLRVLRRWMHRLRILCTFPTLWRNFCGDCVARRWMVGNDDWDVLCMGCLTGWSRADRLALALRRDRMHEPQECDRGTNLGRLGHQQCKKSGDGQWERRE